MFLYSFFKRRKKALIPLVVLTALTCVYLNGTRFDLSTESGNYLENLNYQYRDTSFNDFFFGKGAVHNLNAERFFLLSREHEFKRCYGLMNAYEEQAYFEQMSALSRAALTEAQIQVIGGRAEWILQGIDRRYDLSSMRTPASIAATVAAIYTGRLIEYRATDGVIFKSQTRMHNSQMEKESMGVDTPVVNANLECEPGSTSGDPYRAGVARNIPGIDTVAGASYGPVSQSTSVTLTKSLTKHLSVSYGHTDSRVGTDNTVGVGFSAGF